MELDSAPARSRFDKFAFQSVTKPIAHCNKSRDPVDLLQKFRLRRISSAYIVSVWQISFAEVSRFRGQPFIFIFGPRRGREIA